MHGHWMWDGSMWRLPTTEEVRSGAYEKKREETTTKKKSDPIDILDPAQKTLGTPQKNSLGI
jgi:hypothetical protein